MVLKIRPSKEAGSTSSFQVTFWKQGGHTESEKCFHLGYQPFSGEDGELTELWCCYFHPLGTGMESSYFLRICCVHRKTKSEKNLKKEIVQKTKGTSFIQKYYIKCGSSSYPHTEEGWEV